MHGRRGIKHVAEGVAALAVLGFLLAIAFLHAGKTTPTHADFGATFSTLYAAQLGLDVHATYLAILDDLQIKHLRLPLYWSSIEQAPDSYDWSDVDWMLKEAQQRGVQVTLAIGRKVPRWPECFMPDWAESLSSKDQQAALTSYLHELILRYDGMSSVVRYQVENEALLPFGSCPLPDPELYKAEIDLVHNLSKKPVMLTVSGEQDAWVDVAVPADVLGASLYKTTWNDLIGYFIFPVGSTFYQVKLAVARPFVTSAVLSELQAEPWFAQAQTETPLPLQAKLFTVDDLHTQVELAKSIGFDEIDLWGVEWWYWMKLQGRPDLWEAGKKIYGF